jgi:hypothetical protein
VPAPRGQAISNSHQQSRSFDVAMDCVHSTITISTMSLVQLWRLVVTSARRARAAAAAVASPAGPPPAAPQPRAPPRQASVSYSVIHASNTARCTTHDAPLPLLSLSPPLSPLLLLLLLLLLRLLLLLQLLRLLLLHQLFLL